MTNTPYEPCSDCPFRTDKRPFPLGRERRQDISCGILGDSAFSCHKTTKTDIDGNHYFTPTERPCVGAVRMVEKNKPGGVRGNLMMRFEIMRGALDPSRIAGGKIPTETDPEKFTNTPDGLS